MTTFLLMSLRQSRIVGHYRMWWKSWAARGKRGTKAKDVGSPWYKPFHGDRPFHHTCGGHLRCVSRRVFRSEGSTTKIKSVFRDDTLVTNARGQGSMRAHNRHIPMQPTQRFVGGRGFQWNTKEKKGRVCESCVGPPCWCCHHPQVREAKTATSKSNETASRKKARHRNATSLAPSTKTIPFELS